MYMHTGCRAVAHIHQPPPSNCLNVAYHVFPIGLHAAAADGAIGAISIHVHEILRQSISSHVLGIFRSQIKPVALPCDAGREGERFLAQADKSSVSD